MTSPSLAAEIATLERLVEAEEPDWADYEVSLCRALALSGSAAELRTLLASASVGDGLFEGTPPRAIALALLARVERLSGDDRAAAWAIALRSAVPDLRALAAGGADASRAVWRAAFAERREGLLSLASSDASATPQLALTLAILDDLLPSERSWLVDQLAQSQPDGAVLLAAARHALAIGPAALEKTCARLVAKPPRKANESKQWSVAGAIAACFATGAHPPGLEETLGVALTFTAPMPRSWSEPPWAPPLTAGSLLVALVVAASPLPVSKDAIVRMLCAATPTSSLDAQARAELLVSLAFFADAEPIPERVGPVDSMERAVLESLAQPTYRDAHGALRRVGFWSHAGLVEWLAARGPRFRRVPSQPGEPAHALGVFRAAIGERLALDDAFARITEGASIDDVAGLLFQPAERAFTVAVANTPLRRRRERELATRLLGWLRERSDDYAALLDRHVASPFALAPLLLLAVLDAAARGLLTLGETHARLVRVGLLETPEHLELEPLFAAVPGGSALFAHHRPAT
jgi:hypothetical protein